MKLETQIISLRLTYFFADLKMIPFEHLKLERKLGKGGFGTVYLSKWHTITCAVKQIQTQDIIEGPERDRIIQEALTHR